MSEQQEERKQMDSKVARSFLRMVLQDFGKRVPDELMLNSWELYDLCSKNISCLLIRVKNAEKMLKNMQKLDEGRRQRVFAAIEEYFKTHNQE